MSPCRNNRKRIALMAADVLDDRQSQPLQAHLKICPDCRRYLAEISRLTEKLSSSIVTSNIEASDHFHQRIVRSITTGAGQSSAEQRLTIKSWFIGCLDRPRKTAFALGASLALVTALFVLTVSQHDPATPKSSLRTYSQLSLSGQITSVPSPTLSNYRKAVNGSPEKLDELLALQCRRHSQSMPILTASIWSSRTDSD
jgi:hypothetical protein